tara:strand:- start:864 stop:1112 length:249 start_codon:yes stop_codon:yes gene_type:complete
LGLAHVPVLYDGLYDASILRSITPNTNVSEGYVVRLASEFSFAQFPDSIAKWVRRNHVQSEEHWMHKAVVANGLASESGDEQ